MSFEAQQCAIVARVFVGREAELERLDALARERERAHVVHLFGPGGVGKSALLTVWHERATRLRHAVSLIDARRLAPTADGLRTALEPLVSGAVASVLVDHYELLAPLDGWLRETLVPALPAGVLLVLAQRAPPDARWRVMPGWGEHLHLMPLENLHADEARALLRLCGVAEAQQARALAFTHGHPLALTLVAEALAQQPERVLEDAPLDIISTLVETFIEDAPSAAHRQALEAAALVRSTTEPLLAAMLGAGADVHALFVWLSRRAFFEVHARGVSPHDLARDVIARDLRWRDPERHALLVERAHDYYVARLGDVGSEIESAVDRIFLQRDSPMVRSIFEFSGAEAVRAELATPSDHATISAMTARHEGPEAAALIARWLPHDASRTVVLRGPGPGEVLGYTHHLRLDLLTSAELASDPATRTASAHMKAEAPLRAGESAIFGRWMTRDDYHAPSPLQTLLPASMTASLITTPGLRYLFSYNSNPEVWAPLLQHLGIRVLPEPAFRVGGRAYSMNVVEFLRMSPIDYLRRVTKASAAMMPPGEPPVPVAGPLVQLGREDFKAALRQALAVLAEPRALVKNPLAQCRFVWVRAGPTADAATRAVALAALIQEGVAALGRDARAARAQRALHAAYLRAAEGQKQAADALGLPFSTYRRHLGEGINLLAAALWTAETAGGRR